MNKKEQRMLDKVFNLDCYDQELWVVDNEEYIKNSSDEFKSEIKDLNFTTGQSALENLNADFYNQTIKRGNLKVMKLIVEIKNVYGVPRVYPVCVKSHSFARIAGLKTLSPEVIEEIKKMGYKLTEEKKEI
jgi:hypothetical protein